MINSCYPDNCNHCGQHENIEDCPTWQYYQEWKTWAEENVRIENYYTAKTKSELGVSDEKNNNTNK